MSSGKGDAEKARYWQKTIRDAARAYKRHVCGLSGFVLGPRAKTAGQDHGNATLILPVRLAEVRG
jgi:hypothetical protein